MLPGAVVGVPVLELGREWGEPASSDMLVVQLDTTTFVPLCNGKIGRLLLEIWKIFVVQFQIEQQATNMTK